MSRESILEDNVERITAARRLSENDHGKTFMLSLAGGFAVTLPPLRSGLKLDFIVRVAPTTAYTIVTHGSANVIRGSNTSADLNAASDADFETSGCDTITFVASQAVVGDSVSLICDGTHWYAKAVCSLFSAITYTTAS